ncbi:hypothetical protein BDZ88DRAFT_422323 [Geranomyces variabilis]|nr:hypothetical protein BDZ88DRAFT_422323 [Geranomyces variabilis]KAJ3133628.1 hypothetical protein HDU90_005706 [Geranomyces variabilis]
MADVHAGGGEGRTAKGRPQRALFRVVKRALSLEDTTAMTVPASDLPFVDASEDRHAKRSLLKRMKKALRSLSRLPISTTHGAAASSSSVSLTSASMSRPSPPISRKSGTWGGETTFKRLSVRDSRLEALVPDASGVRRHSGLESLASSKQSTRSTRRGSGVTLKRRSIRPLSSSDLAAFWRHGKVESSDVSIISAGGASGGIAEDGQLATLESAKYPPPPDFTEKQQGRFTVIRMGALIRPGLKEKRKFTFEKPPLLPPPPPPPPPPPAQVIPDLAAPAEEESHELVTAHLTTLNSSTLPVVTTVEDGATLRSSLSESCAASLLITHTHSVRSVAGYNIHMANGDSTRSLPPSPGDTISAPRRMLPLEALFADCAGAAPKPRLSTDTASSSSPTRAAGSPRAPSPAAVVVAAAAIPSDTELPDSSQLTTSTVTSRTGRQFTVQRRLLREPSTEW